MKGELNAAAQHRKLRAAIEKTIVRDEADAPVVVSTHEECALVRRALKKVVVV